MANQAEQLITSPSPKPHQNLSASIKHSRKLVSSNFESSKPFRHRKVTSFQLKKLDEGLTKLCNYICNDSHVSQPQSALLPTNRLQRNKVFDMFPI